LTEKSVEKAKPAPKTTPKSYDNAVTTPVVSVPESVKAVKEEKKVAPKPAPKKTTPKAAPKTKSTGKVKLVQNPNQDLYKIQLIRPEKTGYGVQIASMTDYENVFRQVTDLQSDWFKNILISVSGKGDATTYRIILGPFPDAKTADAYKASLLKKKKRKGFVVDLSTL